MSNRGINPESVEALAKRYQGMTAAIARSYSIPGLDEDDIQQEAWFGLLEAARNYKGKAGVPFARFADRVIRLRLWDLAAREGRGKRRILNDAVRQLRTADGDWVGLEELVADPSPLTDEIAEHRETLRRLARSMREDLTEIERRAICGVLNGRSYRWIGDEISATHRGVDNAVQRARRKLREAA